MIERKHPSNFEVLFAILVPFPNANEIYYTANGWTAVTAAYKQAGDLLADAVTAALPNDSALVLPMLFCYRHFIELQLKELILQQKDKNGQSLSTNDLNHRIEALRAKVERRIPISLNPNDWEAVEDNEARQVLAEMKRSWDKIIQWCGRFVTADPGSMRFRYPTARDATDHSFPDLRTEFQVSGASALKDEMTDFKNAVSKIRILFSLRGQGKIAKVNGDG